jgi:hypothetical protein
VTEPLRVAAKIERGMARYSRLLGPCFVVGAAGCAIVAPLDGLTGGLGETALPDGGGADGVADSSNGGGTDAGSDSGGAGAGKDGETDALSNGDAGLDGQTEASGPSGIASGDLRLYYGTTKGSLAYRVWSHTSQIWQPSVTLAMPGGILSWARPALSPMTGQELVGVADTVTTTALDLFANAEPPSSIATSSLGQSAHRGFDVSMSSSGDGMLVYEDGVSTIPMYRTYRDGSWSNPQQVFSSDAGVSSAGVVGWVQLASSPPDSPTPNEVSLVYTDEPNRHLYGVVWDGQSWSAAPTVLDADGLNVSPDFAGFAEAYENQSGNLLVIWTPPSACSSGQEPVYFSTKLATPGASFSPRQSYGQVAGAGALVAASEQGTDRIVFSCVEYCDYCANGMGTGGGCNDFSAGVWGGTATKWVDMGVMDLNPAIGIDYSGIPGSIPVAAGWVGSTGKAVAIYTQAPGGFGWATWTAASAWTPQTPSWTHAKFEANFAMAAIPSLTVASPNGDLMLVIEDTGGGLWASSYDGASWTDQSAAAPLATSVQATEGEPLGVVVR